MTEMRSLKEASQITGLGWQVIRRMYIQNKVRGIRSGKKIYINMQSLDNYFNGIEGSNGKDN